MAYEKQTWEIGQVITAENLNHIEDGLASGGVLLVNATEDETAEATTLDKTWQQIHDAAIAVIVLDGDTGYDKGYVKSVNSLNTDYRVFDGDNTYITDSPNGYPVMNWDDGGVS